jgi:hypothetical protein
VPKTVYLSSTYADLVDHRQHAYRALRRLGLNVVAMEDYVAADNRPADQCLADVAAADLYIGLFAFRYGYVPEDGNPEKRSITEMEFRHAVDCNKPRLIFRVPDDALWRQDHTDSQHKEGDHGARIRALREELGRERLLSAFTTPQELGEVVTAAAARWLLQVGEIARPEVVEPVGPHPRQLRSDVLLLHSEADRDDAAALATQLRAAWSVETSHTGLLAASKDKLRDLDHLVTAARSVAVLLTPSSCTVLREDEARSRRILRMARDRSGALFGVSLTSPGPLAEWGWDAMIESRSGVGAAANDLHLAISRGAERSDLPEIGLPFVVVAMTDREAAELLADPPEPVAALVDVAGADVIAARYGPDRTQWKPFRHRDETILRLLTAAATTTGSRRGDVQVRRIRPQAYPLDRLMDDGLAMWPIYDDIARSGCLVIADELSMFHPGVRDVFVASPLHSGAQVAFATLSPLDPGASPPYDLMRRQLNSLLRDAARRFDDGLDPLCELNVSGRQRFVRWLHGSLPLAVDALRDAKRDDARIAAFAQELGAEAQSGMVRLIAGEKALP